MLLPQYIDLALSPKEPEAIANWYDALSASYDEVYGDEQERKHRKIIETLKEIKFENFVDVGCGTGRLLEMVSSRSRLSVGIDISGQMLKKAKERTDDQSTQFVRAEASHLPLRDHIADGVVAVSVSEHGQPFAGQFQELSRIATRTGVLSMTVFGDINRSLQDQFVGKQMKLVGSLSDREQLWTMCPNSE